MYVHPKITEMKEKFRRVRIKRRLKAAFKRTELVKRNYHIYDEHYQNFVDNLD